MDYFQGVVTEFLRADRRVFVNTECLLQLDPGDPPKKGRHWYCDAVAINMRHKTVFLCEITYSATMQSLLGRLQGWRAHWAELCEAIYRDCEVPSSWQVQPWMFIPERCHRVFGEKFAAISATGSTSAMPTPRVTYLESVAPWNYRSWDRRGDALVLGAETAKAELRAELESD